MPRLRVGELAVDDRGSVAYVNEANIEGYVRFYLVRNHSANFVRAWHGHKKERKLITVVTGAALVCCVRIDDWTDPSSDAEVHRFVLSAAKPAALEIPPGFANGSMSLVADTTLCYLSDTPIEQASADDYRFPSRRWDPWHVVER